MSRYLAGRHSRSVSASVLPPDLGSSVFDGGQSYLIVSIRECRGSSSFNETHSVFPNFEHKTIFLLLRPTKGFGNNNNS